MHIKLNKKQWEDIGKKAGWHGDPEIQDANVKALQQTKTEIDKVVKEVLLIAEKLQLNAELINVDIPNSSFTMKITNPLS